MFNFIFLILTNRNLERFRATVPTPIYIGILTFILAIPIMLITALFKDGLNAFLPPNILNSLMKILLFSITSGGIIGTLYGIMFLIGKLSGYCPFIYEWTKVDEYQAEIIRHNIKLTAEKVGFDIYWEKKGIGLIGVRGIELENKNGTQFHSGEQFPMRLSLLENNLGDGNLKIKLKVEVRTITIWDTGETKRLKEIGNFLIKNELVSSTNTSLNYINNK